MLIYFITNSQFVQGIWTSITSVLAGIGAYALYIIIAIFGIALIMGAVGSRSIGKSTKGFMNVLKTIIVFLAVNCIWKVICWLLKNIWKGLVTFWKFLQRNLQKGFQRHVSEGPSKVLSNLFTFLIVITILFVI